MAKAFDVNVADLPEGWTALEVIAAVKAMDNRGRSVLCLRSSEGLTVWEAVGMLRCLEKDTLNDFENSLRSDT